MTANPGPEVHGAVVHGDGWAARICVSLLERAGVSVAQVSAGGGGVPVMMVPEASVSLLEDVLGPKAMLREVSRIRRRVVRWGPGAVAEFPHSAVVLSARSLDEALPVGPGTKAEAGWDIYCVEPVASKSFGRRRAVFQQVLLRDGCARDACWVESLRQGWVFLIPSGETAWLIAVGTEDPLRESLLVGPLIEQPVGEPMAAAAYPRVAWPLAGKAWLTAGSAAIRFDPLCGDGTGHAAREAILAAAVVKAAGRGEDAEALARHYSSRLLAGFRRHLEACVPFYAAGGENAWWRGELLSLHEGIAFCDEQLAGITFRYRLNGLELEPR